VQITSFGKQLLEDKFPNAAQQSQQRARYIPIGRSPEWSAPHPDTGMLLKLHITGDPAAPGKGRQSYVCLGSPSLVAKHHLRPLFDGTARLTTNSLVQVVNMLNEMNCTATITLPVNTTPSRAPSRPQRADTSSHYSNATHAQPRRDPPRVPPRPQRAESSSQYYGNISPPRDPPRAPPRPQPAGGDRNRKNEEESTFSMGDVLWLGAAAIVVVKVGLKVFFGR